MNARSKIFALAAWCRAIRLYYPNWISITASNKQSFLGRLLVAAVLSLPNRRGTAAVPKPDATGWRIIIP